MNISAYYPLFEFFNTSQEEEKVEISFVGSYENPVSKVGDRGAQLDREHYFFERIPIPTEKGEIHIYGQNLDRFVNEWKSEIQEKKTTADFQSWIKKQLENKELLESLLPHQVRYFTDQERTETEVHVQKGKLSQIGLDSQSQAQKPLKKGSYAFVIGEFYDSKSASFESKLFAAEKMKTKKGKIQHSSFLDGGNALSSGMFEVNAKGEIESIRSQSGHYKPTPKEVAIMLKYLLDENYDISKIEVNCAHHLVQGALNLLGISSINNQNGKQWYESTGKLLII